MEPGNTDNTDDDVVQPPVNNNENLEAGKTAPTGKSKKPDFSNKTHWKLYSLYPERVS